MTNLNMKKVWHHIHNKGSIQVEISSVLCFGKLVSFRCREGKLSHNRQTCVQRPPGIVAVVDRWSLTS